MDKIFKGFIKQYIDALNNDIDIDLFSNLTQKEFVYVIKNRNIDQIKKLNNDESQ